MMKIIPGRLIPKLTKNPHNHLQIPSGKVSQPKKTTYEKESTSRHIVTIQSRQQSIFNNKIESGQTRFTEELYQQR